MRILHISSEAGWRGGEQQLAYLLGDLIDRDVKCVLAVKKGSALERFAHERKISCYALGLSHSFDLKSALNVHHICRTERIDLVHLHSSKAQSIGVLSTFYGNRVPMVLSRRVAFLPGGNFLTKWKYNHKQIKRILCVSNRITQIMQRYVADPSRCHTVYSGIDLRKFDHIKPDRSFLIQDFGLDPSREIITAVGAVDKSKDHLTFIKTIEKLVGDGRPVQGLIVGDGPLAATLKAYVEQQQLGAYVKFAGYRKDVGKILLSSDIFLMTSREEGLGTSLLDAFLARVPVVATDAGGIPEIVIHERTGMLDPIADSDKLAAAIARLLDDTVLRKSIVRQAYEFVQEFSKDKTTANTLKVYKEVLHT
jgi:glycosyltransferase involved in cell wall biosynthesis